MTFSTNSKLLTPKLKRNVVKHRIGKCNRQPTNHGLRSRSCLKIFKISPALVCVWWGLRRLCWRSLLEVGWVGEERQEMRIICLRVTGQRKAFHLSEQNKIFNLKSHLQQNGFIIFIFTCLPVQHHKLSLHLQYLAI